MQESNTGPIVRYSPTGMSPYAPDLQPRTYTTEPVATTNYGHLIRRYIWAGLLLLLAGAAGGVVSVVLQSPVYRGRAVMELRTTTNPLARGRGGDQSVDPSQVEIQTHIQLLHTGAFLRSVIDRLQSETVPPPPVHVDVFSRLRSKIKTSTHDPLSIMREGIESAVGSFEARPVNGTRLIELSCTSTHPDIAATFLNTVANEYVDQNLQASSANAQKTGQWLAGQLEETRTKLQEAEGKLQEFVRASGNLFVSQDNTLADSKLRQLQGELSAIQADRIAKQTRFEMLAKTSPDTIADVLNDATLRSYQDQIVTLRRDLAAQRTTLAPTNYKVERIQAQINELEKALKQALIGATERVRSEYEAALRREKLLSGAYSSQAGQVSSQAGKATQYNALKRETEILRQTYNAMLLQSNENSIATSLPINNLRVVEPSTPLNEPYKPKPILNIGFGVVVGLALTVGGVFVREHMDQRLKSPTHLRELLNAPELGVIPSAESLAAATFVQRLNPRRGRKQQMEMQAVTIYGSPSVGAPQTIHGALLAESFRATLASLMRKGQSGRGPEVILVTSPGPAEGKTTVVTNLGVALANAGKRVLLIDADFIRPKLHHAFSVKATYGLIDILKERRPIREYDPKELVQASSLPTLFVMPRGTLERDYRAFLHDSRIAELFRRLRTEFDMIVIDTAPLLSIADARILSNHADGVVLVVRSDVTTRAGAREAYERLREDRILVLGTVLNGWKAPNEKHGYYSYYANSD